MQTRFRSETVKQPDTDAPRLHWSVLCYQHFISRCKLFILIKFQPKSVFSWRSMPALSSVQNDKLCSDTEITKKRHWKNTKYRSNTVSCVAFKNNRFIGLGFSLLHCSNFFSLCIACALEPNDLSLLCASFMTCQLWCICVQSLWANWHELINLMTQKHTTLEMKQQIATKASKFCIFFSFSCWSCLFFAVSCSFCSSVLVFSRQFAFFGRVCRGIHVHLEGSDSRPPWLGLHGGWVQQTGLCRTSCVPSPFWAVHPPCIFPCTPLEFSCYLRILPLAAGIYFGRFFRLGRKGVSPGPWCCGFRLWSAAGDKSTHSDTDTSGCSECSASTLCFVDSWSGHTSCLKWIVFTEARPHEKTKLRGSAPSAHATADPRT